MAKNVSKEIIAKRYAQALFELASADDVGKTVSEDLQSLTQSFDNEVYHHLGSTHEPIEEKIAAIDAILKKAKTHTVTHDFITMLVKQDRLVLLPQITVIFDEMQHQNDHVHIVQVTVAMPLKATQEKKIIQNLTKTLNAKKVELDVTIDPDVLGGIRLQHGSILIDNTFDNKINLMAQAMKGL